MDPDADSIPGNDYHEMGQSPNGIQPVIAEQPGTAHSREPEILIEIVVIDGPEGERLQALQAEAVRHVLTRLAERSRRDATAQEG